MVLMLITDGDKSHYVHIKDLGRFVFNKTKNKNKKCFWKICLQRFSSKKIRAKYKEVRLSLTGVHSLRLEKGTIELKNYFKQIPVTFKIYVYFVWFKECWKLWRFLFKSFTYKLVCVDDEFTKPIVVFRGENAAYKFIEAILEEYQYCQKVMKIYFHKNLIMSDKEEEQFKLSNTR